MRLLLRLALMAILQLQACLGSSQEDEITASLTEETRDSSIDFLDSAKVSGNRLEIFDRTFDQTATSKAFVHRIIENNISLDIHDFNCLRSLMEKFFQFKNLTTIILNGHQVIVEFLNCSREYYWPRIQTLHLFGSSTEPIAIDTLAAVANFSALKILRMYYIEFTTLTDDFVEELLMKHLTALEELDLSDCFYSYFEFNMLISRDLRDRKIKINQALPFGKFSFENGMLTSKYFKDVFFFATPLLNLFRLSELLVHATKEEKDSIQNVAVELNDKFLLRINSVLWMLERLPNLSMFTVHFAHAEVSSIQYALNSLPSSVAANLTTLSLVFSQEHKPQLSPLIIRFMDLFENAESFIFRFPTKALPAFRCLKRAKLQNMKSLTLDFILVRSFFTICSKWLISLPTIENLHLKVHFMDAMSTRTRASIDTAVITVTNLHLEVHDNDADVSAFPILLERFNVLQQFKFSYYGDEPLKLHRILPLLAHFEYFSLFLDDNTELNGHALSSYLMTEIPKQVVLQRQV